MKVGKAGIRTWIYGSFSGYKTWHMSSNNKCTIKGLIAFINLFLLVTFSLLVITFSFFYRNTLYVVVYLEVGLALWSLMVVIIKTDLCLFVLRPGKSD